MAEQLHLEVISRGVEVWNSWRSAYPQLQPDLSHADLRNARLMAAHLKGANLQYTDLSNANLGTADLRQANLRYARLNGARLSQATLLDADLSFAELNGAWLNDAILIESNLFRAMLKGATLLNARLSGAIMIGTNLEQANLAGCAVQGVFAWGLRLKGAKQTNLAINRPRMPRITVDNLEVALLLHLRMYREQDAWGLDELLPKIVLILGHYSKDRSLELATIQDEVRKNGYIPLRVECTESTEPDFAELNTLMRLSNIILLDQSEYCPPMKKLRVCLGTQGKRVFQIRSGKLKRAGQYRLANRWFHLPSPSLRFSTPEELRFLVAEKVLNRTRTLMRA